jgi:hypothetical protein
VVEGYGGLSLRRSLFLIYIPGHGGRGEGVGTFLRPLFFMLSSDNIASFLIPQGPRPGEVAGGRQIEIVPLCLVQTG